jgi:hypothetical protein
MAEYTNAKFTGGSNGWILEDGSYRSDFLQIWHYPAGGAYPEAILGTYSTAQIITFDINSSNSVLGGCLQLLTVTPDAEGLDEVSPWDA